MKKLLTIAALIGATSLSFGQGFVSFANTSATRFSTNTPSSSPGTGMATAAGIVPLQYYFELFIAPSTQNTISTTADPTLNGWTALALGTNLTAVGTAGRLLGNNADAGAAYGPIAGFPGPSGGGSTADFAVAGWTANIGSTWALAQTWWNNGQHDGALQGAAILGGAWFGIAPSIANDIALGNAGGPYNATFGTLAGQIPSMPLSYYAVAPVPEPSTFALAGLGAAALLIFRRRKA